jgi:hypothetical protein
MGLYEKLTEAKDLEDARRARKNPHPKGFEPGVKYGGDGYPTEITTDLLPHLQAQKDWDEAVASMGIPVPDGYRLRLVEAKYDPAAWHRNTEFMGHPGEDNSSKRTKSPAVTRPVWRYRFAVEQIPVQISPEDGVDTLLRLRKDRTRIQPKYDGPAAFVLSWNDWQVGKWLREGEGSQQIVERLDASFNAAIARVEELRIIGRGLGQLVIIGGGDMIENCAVFKNQAYQIDLDRRGQINLCRNLILEGLDRLAPHFDKVDVMVVGGNHGEHRIEQERVNLSDNDDCAVFEHAAAAAERDPRLSHVGFNIATDSLSKTMNVNGWILGTTHGHVFGKTAGTSPEIKARNWFMRQAAGRTPIGDSDVLITHHFHHDAGTNWGSCLWRQTRTMDGGSPHFSEYAGTICPPGMLSAVITETDRWVDEQYL